MKLIVIIAITIILLIPIDIFTQEESSSELTARLDAKNSSVCKIGRLWWEMNKNFTYTITLSSKDGELSPSDESHKQFYDNMYQNLEKCVAGNEKKIVYENGKNDSGQYTVIVSYADPIFIGELLDKLKMTEGSFELYHKAFVDMLQLIKEHFEVSNTEK